MIDQAILQQNIITALGLENLPAERKAALVEKMAALVEKNLTVRMLEGLSEADTEEFGKLEQGTDEDRAKFLQSKFANLPEMLEEEIVNVKKAVLEAGKIE